MPSPVEVQSLFRAFFREARKHSNYNIRAYVRRSVSREFKKNAGETDPARVQQLFDFGKDQLALVRRSVLVQALYGRPQRLILEVQGRGA